KKATEGGNINAQSNLGYCYEKGIGTPVDHQKAFGSFAKAAENGHLRAQVVARRLRRSSVDEKSAKSVEDLRALNDTIDDLVEVTEYFSRIPFEKFSNIKFAAQGGYGTIYEADMMPLKMNDQ